MGEDRTAGLNLVSLDAALWPLGHDCPNIGQLIELHGADFFLFRTREPVFPVLQLIGPRIGQDERLDHVAYRAYLFECRGHSV